MPSDNFCLGKELQEDIFYQVRQVATLNTVQPVHRHALGYLPHHLALHVHQQQSSPQAVGVNILW